MSETQKANGTCLCGAVKLEVAALKKNVGVCHCGMCRKWSAGPMMSVDGGSDVSIDGIHHVTVYGSSEWAERAFCNKCGTSLYYRFKPLNQYIFSVSLFDDLEKVKFDHQIYIDHKPDFYSFANKTQNMTEEEVLALYSGGEEQN